MAAGTTPISPRAPATDWGTAVILIANTAMDGTGIVGTVLTAGIDGAKINRLRITHLGANVATVIRFFINNGLTNATPANNALLGEVTVLVNVLSQVAASTSVDYPMNFVLKPSHKINYVIGTGVASGHKIVADAGDY